MNLFLIFVFNFFLSIALFPVLIRVSKQKKIFATQSSRSSHTKDTPNIGGVIFYICLIFTISFSRDIWKEEHSHLLTPSFLVIILLGLKDDITGTRPIIKLIGQIIASFFMILNVDFQVINDLNLNANFINTHFLSNSFIIFIIIFIINSINLIDGINTLASQLCIFYFSILSVIFYQNNDMLFLGICISLIASLLPFTYFNLKGKLFMGDTGSMLLGFIISICILRLITHHNYHILSNYNKSIKAILLFSLILIPVIDLSRVFILRIMKNKNPFQPDKNHIHHNLLNILRLNHFQTSFIILLANIIIFLTVLFLFKTKFIF